MKAITLKNIKNIEDSIEFAIELSKNDKNVDVLDIINTLSIINKNRDLLDLFDKYDKGLLKDKDLSFDFSKYISQN